MATIVTQSIDGQLSGLEINNVVVSPSVQKLTFPGKWINNDVTAFGSVGRRYAPGIDETKFTIEMLWNRVATNSNGQLKINGLCSIPEYDITAQVGTYVKAVAVCYVDNGVTFSTI
jgi:hypothetical protein